MTQPPAPPLARPFVYAPPPGPPDILHQDADILVLNKPSGLLTVPGRPEEHADSLKTRVQQRFPDARVVHRLDLDTSGVIVMALNAQAHRHLGLQFERRKTAKTYVARIHGHPDRDWGRIELPLIVDWPNRPRQMVDHTRGRPAITDWEVIGWEDTATRVHLHPITGRSHQLRVHMLSLGHPILGDPLYAHEAAFQAADRLHLHAESLTVHHPTGGQRHRFEVPCPF